MTQWYGLAAPRGTPAAVTERLAAAVKEALKSPELLKVYRGDGATEGQLSGRAFRDFVVRDLTTPAFLPSAGYQKIVDDERAIYARIVPKLPLEKP